MEDLSPYTVKRTGQKTWEIDGVHHDGVIAGLSAQFERMVNNQICSIELVDDTKYVLRCRNTPDAVSHTDIILATET